jgi:hypothetical protein
MRFLLVSAFVFTSLSLSATAAKATPGLGEKIYGAKIEAGVTEVEARYGKLNGKADDGKDALVLEAAHSFSNKFYAALLTELVREPSGGSGREVEALAIEAIYALGRINTVGIDTAIYGEYEIGLNGPNKVETKLILQKKADRFDSRLNLIFEKELRQGERMEIGYAASADVKVVGDFRLGAAAFGEFGSFSDFAPRAEHFLGPVAKMEFEHLPGKGELEIEVGYLFALGEARDNARSQYRLLMEYEFHF